MWQCRWYLLCMVGLWTAAAAYAPGATKDTWTLESARAKDSVDRVEASLEVAGKLKVIGDSDKTETLQLNVLANLKYDERSLEVPLSPAATRRAVRYYDQAAASIKIEETATQPTLRSERRLIAVEADPTKATLFSPRGPLTADELDLIDLQANTLLLDRLLPPRPVAVGDSWDHSKELMALLLGLDAVKTAKVQSTLSSTKGGAALAEMSGTVEGAVGGIATQIALRAKYQYHLTLHRVTWFGMVIQEKRAVGHIGSGLDVVARLQIKITPIEQSQHLTAEALDGLALGPTEESTRLEYRSPQGGWRLLNDRRWFVTAGESDRAILRLIDRGEFVAQCNIASMPAADPQKLISLKAFQKDIREGLGDSFGQFVKASQKAGESGYRVLRVVVDGESSELPIRWIYYQVADREGHQMVLVFIVEANLIERLGEADEALVAGVSFRDDTMASKPTPAAPR